MRRDSFAHDFGSLRRLPPAGALAPGRPRGAGLRPRAQDRIHQRVTKPPTVQLIQPPVRNIVRVVGQPSFIESYERTSIYPKLTAYIEKWIVDIGDKVKKGDVLATLFVPELVEELETKKATVELDQERIALAKKVVEVAKADVKAAEARLEEAKAILDKYQAEVDRWDSEVKRLERPRSTAAWSIPQSSSSRPISSSRAPRRGTRPRRPSRRRRRSCSPRRPRSRRPRSTSGSPKPT